MKSEMLTSLKRRYSDVEEREELMIATTMDPRYKDKFFSKPTTKLFVIKLVVDRCTEITESTADGPPSKRQHLDDHDSTAASTSKVWECIAEILEDSGQLSDVSVVREIEGMVNTNLNH